MIIRTLLKYFLFATVAVPLMVPAPRAEEAATAAGDTLPYDRMADRIADALAIGQGEKIIIGHDPTHMPELARRTHAALSRKGAEVGLRAYGADDSFEDRLADADIYVWLPAGPDSPTASMMRELPIAGAWVMEGTHRQIHFHWNDGTRATDGMNGIHSEAYGHVYAHALEIDYAALDGKMRRAAAVIRGGAVHVTTPAGTDIRFEVGERPFTIQNGDASLAATRDAVVPIQREIELPAGALRIAPIEASVSGVMVIPYARLLAHPWARSDAGPPVTNLRLTIKAGIVTEVAADRGADLFRAFLGENPSLRHFREFALGFNPRLVAPEDSEWIPYYGYGAGVVRLSLGDNQELGGAVTGGGTRWFLFTDATVTAADGSVLARDGALGDF